MSPNDYNKNKKINSQFLISVIFPFRRKLEFHHISFFFFKAQLLFIIIRKDLTRKAFRCGNFPRPFLLRVVINHSQFQPYDATY